MAGGATRNARKSRKRKNSEDSTSAAPSRTLKHKLRNSALLALLRAWSPCVHCAGADYLAKSSEARDILSPKQQYSVDEKLEIIEFAKGNGNRAAGREYNVAESSIREWRKNEEKLRAVNNCESEKQDSAEAVSRQRAIGQIENHDKDKGVAATHRVTNFY
ncbi:hypothetical protein COOONC_00088 [Cooperia oncophora]